MQIKFTVLTVAMLLLATTTSLTAASLKTTTDTATKLTDSLFFSLDEIVLQSSFVKERGGPLRISTLTHKEIEQRAIGQTYPELIKKIPGLYATAETGSYGDARVNIRGFKQENISVLLNGIPISGLVTGNMFWNNWLGLTDATHSIQVQKGVGGSMLSDNSVGGTINIITKTAERESSLALSMATTSYGEYKSTVALNSGELKGGWSISLLGSYTGGKGFPLSTGVSSGAYLLSVNKEFNPKHSLLLTLLGGPERHKQRSTRLSAKEIEQYGRHYNKNWGYHKGVERNLSENFYHKPYLTLNHYYKPNEKGLLSTTLYLTVGDGGGNWSETKGKPIIQYRKEGLIDWDGVEEANRTNSPEALHILSHYLAGHTQTGVRVNYLHNFRPNLEFQGGVHYSYYSTWEKERITDLLGANYWLEEYDKSSLAGVAGREQKKLVGDYVRTYGGKVTNHATLYSSLHYKKREWDIRGGASLMGSSNSRWDLYNYPDNPNSKVATALGYSLKGGVARKFGRHLSLYLNGGYYSRLPYHNLFFSSGNNNITEGVKNENNLLGEFGGRVLFDRGAIEVTTYYALWKNKSLISNPYKQQDESVNRYLVRGLDALHRGVELTFDYRFTHNLAIEGFVGFGDWKWKNDVSASIYHPYTSQLVEEINLYTKGLPVGDAPQRELSLTLLYNPTKTLFFELEWFHYSYLYADFNPADRAVDGERKEPFRMPNYSLLNGHLRWNPPFLNRTKERASLLLSVNNILDSSYIERGRDGKEHNLESFTGFWGAPINGSVAIRIKL